MTAIRATIFSIVFRNEDNGYTVFRVVNRRISRDKITVTGIVASIHEGQEVECEGEWITSIKYGRQFKSSSVTVLLPSTELGIERYLSSDLIKGIGKYYAKEIVKRFGKEVFQIIENEPQRLQEIRGISQRRVQEISKSWAEHKSIQDIMVFLQGLGIGVLNATKIYKTLGNDAIDVIREDPYRLVGLIKGLGFITVDKIALNAGISKDSDKRIKAAINYLINLATGEGHCGLPREDILKRAIKLLEAEAKRIEECISEEISSGNLVEESMELPVSQDYKEQGREELFETSILFNKYLYSEEKTIAGKIKSILFQRPRLYNESIENIMQRLESKQTIKLAEQQKLAIALSTKCNILVITGGPGTGKTTILKALLELHKQYNSDIKLCAPTGRAAKRLSESTGEQAYTIHRLLKIDPVSRKFGYNKDNPLKSDILIVDESSMIDVPLMWAVVNSIEKGTQLILVGDIDQLPSVGPGRVLADMIESEAVPVVRLNEIFRQAKESSIITNAHNVNKGVLPDLSNSKRDFIFIDASQGDLARNKLTQVIKHNLPKAFGYDPIKDIQVLSPMQRGMFGVRILNELLQKELNQHSQSESSTSELFGHKFAVGDKVMQVENNYDKDVYNGDIGYIEQIDKHNKLVTIKYESNNQPHTQPTIYQYDEMFQVVLAYATTIHKSQGSEYPVVVIPIFREQMIMLQRNLLYTAITRGKERVVLIGEKSAIKCAVENFKTKLRYTKLKQWLIANKNYV